MIKAVLLDLDDTLITTHSDAFFPDYVGQLTKRLGAIAPEETALSALRAGLRAAIANPNPLVTVREAFMVAFGDAIGGPHADLDRAFEVFYAEDFPRMSSRIAPRARAIPLLDWLFEHDCLVVIATNPVTPETAIHHRMTWGGIPIYHYPFALVTTFETMHFAKPNPEYYEEILARIGTRPEEALMVGDHWDRDIVCAAAAGLNTFWITDGQQPEDNPMVKTDGQGSFETFVDLVLSGWLNTLTPLPRTHDSLLRRLAVTPSAIDALLRNHAKEAIERRPGKDEWSALETISHLRDYELAESRPWLERIRAEDNPFISATSSPQPHKHRPKAPHEELKALAAIRAETVSWLRALPDSVWMRPARHSIFGPTRFEEMIGFMVEHDRTHLHQMRVALEKTSHSRAT